MRFEPSGKRTTATASPFYKCGRIYKNPDFTGFSGTDVAADDLRVRKKILYSKVRGDFVENSGRTESGNARLMHSVPLTPTVQK
jgi:hypothetical protein